LIQQQGPDDFCASGFMPLLFVFLSKQPLSAKPQNGWEGARFVSPRKCYFLSMQHNAAPPAIPEFSP
jgi:hypothetical protein